MLNTLPRNAFQSVRPRGPDVDIPVIPPRKTNASKAPQQGNVHMALDRNGRRTVGLAPRKSGIVIENHEQSAASLAKSQRISKGAR